MNQTHTEFTLVTDVAEVIDLLGGTRAVKDLTGAKSMQVVNNWRALKRFASHTFLVMTAALEEKGYGAPPELWGITSPANAAQHTDQPAAAE